MFTAHLSVTIKKLMFNKIRAKSSFGRHGSQYKYYFVENQSAIKYLP